MGNNAIGASLEIPQSVLNKLNEVDTKLQQIATSADNMSKQVIASFNNIGTQGVDNLLTKINQLQNGLGSIDLNKLANGLDNTATQMSNTAKSAEIMADNMVKATQAVSGVDKNNKSLSLTAEMAKVPHTVNEAITQIKNLQKAVKNVNFNKEWKDGRAFDIVNERINDLKANLKSIQNVKVSPQSALAMDGSSIEKRLAQNKQLEIARKQLNNTDKDYEKTLAQLNAKILENNKANAQAVAGSKELKKQHNNLMDTSGQLARKLALIFSVSQITGYINNMIKVRAEFELQQRSLQAILQNKEEADRLFVQITDLAIRSPFQVKELITYTKELAAYRIETEKLYDTTKMLADISAGLGVDMQRLILAYGQVKAANYLRGQELRQFSEAGINILGELASYFSELKGQAISTGDVFEMVSNRMVSFKDVEQVFKRLTEAGGIFYNMQEIQAETLKGQLSNLRDSLDIMFNEIGKANDSKLKMSVSIIKSLVENWQMLVPILKAVVAAFVAQKIVTLTTSKALLDYAITNNLVNASDTKNLTLKNLLTIATKKFSLAVKSATASMKEFVVANPMLLAITAIGYALTETIFTLQEHSEAIDNITKKYEDLRKSVKDINIRFDYATSTNNIDEQKKSLMKLVDVANRDYQMNIKISYEDLKPEDIIDKFNELKNDINDTNRFAEQFAKRMQEATHWTLQDDIFEDFDDLGKSYQKLDTYIYNTKTNITNSLIEMGNAMSDTQREALKLLEIPRQSDQSKEGYESELVYLERMRKAYSLLYDDARKEYNMAAQRGESAGVLQRELLKAVESLKQIGLDQSFFKISSNVNADLEEATKEFEDFAKTINIPSWIPEEKRTAMIKIAIDKLATERALDNFQIETMYRLANMKFNANIGFSVVPKQEQLQGFEKDFQDWLDKQSFKKFKYNVEIGKGQTNIVADLKSAYDAAEKRYKIMENAHNQIGTYTEEEIKSQKILAEESKKAWIAAGGELSSTARTKGEDIEKSRLSLLKEIKSQYDDLLKYYTKEEAALKVYQNNKSEILRLGLQTNEMTKYELGEYVKLLKTIKQTPDVLKEISKTETLIDVKIKEDSLKQIKDNIDKLLSDYDYSIGIAESGIDPNLLKKMFTNLGLNAEDLDLDPKPIVNVFEKADEEIKKLRDENTQESIKLADEAEQKLNAKKRKYAEDTAKKYLEYTKQSINERARIEGEAQDKINKVKKEQAITGLSNEQVNAIIEQINKDKEEALDALSWKEFKGSDMYINLFDNLEYASNKSIDAMLAELNRLKKSLKNLTPEQLKEIVKQMNTLEKLKVRRNPFEFLFSKDKDLAIEAWKELDSVLKNVGNSVNNIASDMENVFGTMSESSKDALSSFQEILGGVGDMAGGASRIMSGDVISGSIQAFTGLAKTLGSVFAIGDKKKEREIQSQIEKVNDLQKAYEKLEKAIESAYSFDQLKASNEQAQANIKAQIASYEQMVSAEKAKKKTDVDRVKEWQDEIEKLKEQADELQKSQIESLGGIVDKIRSTTREFVDAWYDAFSETGNGLSGLEDKFNEMFINIIKEQASLKIADKFLKPLYDNIDKSLEDYKVTTDEADALKNQASDILPKVSEALEQIFGAFNALPTNDDGKLSGLQKGIQGVTEQTAQALEALLNSMRFFVADSNKQLQALYRAFTSLDENYNPILGELRLQTAQVTSINKLLNSVSKAGHSKGGYGLKVFLD